MPLDRRACPDAGHDDPPLDLKALRARHALTQAQLAARLGVTERQVQRWEAGAARLPAVYAQLLCRTVGVHTARDFARGAHGMTRSWQPERDARRESIERGDVVVLQPLDGPLLWATVCAPLAGGATGYEAIVTEFAGAGEVGEVGEVGEACGGFCLGERVRFDRENVLHLEQRAPRGPCEPSVAAHP